MSEEHIDKFTGKQFDKTSDHFPHLNGKKCDICGTDKIDHCLRCGAPQCCPKCCSADEDFDRHNQDNTIHL